MLIKKTWDTFAITVAYAIILCLILLPLVGTTNEHLELTVALKVPTFVVVTKADLCSEAQMHHTIQQLEHLLTSPGCCKVPFVVKTDGDLCTAAQRFTDERYITSSLAIACSFHSISTILNGLRVYSYLWPKFYWSITYMISSCIW